MFVDTGDYILSKYSLIEILNTLHNNSMGDRYIWRWLNEEYSTYSNPKDNPLMHGQVYRRAFLELYKVKFCNMPYGSYSNEDIGFNHLIDGLMRNIEIYDQTQHTFYYETPIYMYTFNKNSITHKNNGEFKYKKQVIGLIENINHTITYLEINKVKEWIIVEELCGALMRLYYDFLYIIKKKPEFAQQNWNKIREYYFKIYSNYESSKYINDSLSLAYTRYLPMLIKLGIPRINIRRFIMELKNNEVIPNYYLT